MPITKDDFKSAKPGDILRDIKNRSWTVTEALPNLLYPALVVRTPDDKVIKISWLGKQIVNEEFKPIGELAINAVSFVHQKRFFFKKT